MAVGERLYGVPQHEDEVVFKHHESPNAGTDCGSTECGAIRLNHSRCFWRVNHEIDSDAVLLREDRARAFPERTGINDPYTL